MKIYFIANKLMVSSMEKSRLVNMLIKELKEFHYEYLVTPHDISFYNFIDSIWDGNIRSLASTISKGLQNPNCPKHNDPYELPIDANFINLDD